MDKCFIKSFDLICCRVNLLLKTIHIPIVLLLQQNLFHYLTNIVFDGAIFQMVWWPWDDGKIARANTTNHRVMNIRAEKRSKVFPNEYSVKVRAWDIACLNIAANTITTKTKNVGGGASGA
jgi:hypothetical protein